MSEWEKRLDDWLLREAHNHSKIAIDKNNVDFICRYAFSLGRQDLLDHPEEIPTDVLERHPKVKGLLDALDYIVSKKHFIGKPKWDAEFVDCANCALADWGKDGG